MSSKFGQEENDRITRSHQEKILVWLDPNREAAEEKYNMIWGMLLEMFTSNDCPQAEMLAYETISRVAEAPPPPLPFPEAAQLFRRVGKQILREYLTLWASTEEAFGRLLKWLDQGQEKAGEKYARIHSTLCRVFASHGFADAENLADETINRVIKKLPKIEKSYKGDPALYFSRVASFIGKEHARTNEIARKAHTNHVKQQESLEYDNYKQTEEEDSSAARKCFRGCLQQMKQADRDLILGYHDSEQGGKIKDRKELASKLKITMANLRVRRFRIQTALEKCIAQCLKEKGDDH